MTENKTNKILAAIGDERAMQEKRWGNSFDDTHSPADWWTIVSFYFTRGLMSWKTTRDDPFWYDKKALRKDLVKIAAIIVAWIESIDRQENT